MSIPPPPDAFAQARELVTPALRATVGRLSPGIHRVVSYHLGWEDAAGIPVDAASGKSVRPALAYTCAEAVGAEPQAADPGAVAVELVHNFSLLHDDVMDHDTERRHRATAWSLFGIGEAILAGDALLTLAHESLIEPPTSDRLAAAVALSDATGAMITGQAEDLSFEGRMDVTVDACLGMLERKTAALIACACRVGAILGGGSEKEVRALGDFGMHLGLAYQAIDDVLGIWGEEERTGKPTWSDLRRGKRSLPIVAALDAGGADSEHLRKLMDDADRSDERLADIADLIAACGGREMALKIAGTQLGAALERLGSIRTTLPARRSLEEIAGFITTRDT